MAEIFGVVILTAVLGIGVVSLTKPEIIQRVVLSQVSDTPAWKYNPFTTYFSKDGFQVYLRVCGFLIVLFVLTFAFSLFEAKFMK
jgi:hypothetical protein